jgi:hypothetical protein
LFIRDRQSWLQAWIAIPQVFRYMAAMGETPANSGGLKSDVRTRAKRCLAWPISVLLPALAGCFSYASPVGPSNHSVSDVNQGEDCTLLLFDIGHHEPSLVEAMKQGGMTKLRSADYREKTFIGIGQKCITAHGE